MLISAKCWGCNGKFLGLMLMLQKYSLVTSILNWFSTGDNKVIIACQNLNFTTESGDINLIKNRMKYNDFLHFENFENVKWLVIPRKKFISLPVS